MASSPAKGAEGLLCSPKKVGAGLNKSPGLRLIWAEGGSVTFSSGMQISD